MNFAATTITGYNDSTGTAVNLQGTAGTVSFTDLDVTTTAGAGVNVERDQFCSGLEPDDRHRRRTGC